MPMGFRNSSRRISPGWILDILLMIFISLRVIIRDLHPISVPVPPFKADPPLIVDGDGVLALAISGQGVEPVPRRHPQILKGERRVKDKHFASCRADEGRGQPSGGLSQPYPLRFAVPE